MASQKKVAILSACLLQADEAAAQLYAAHGYEEVSVSVWLLGIRHPKWGSVQGTEPHCTNLYCAIALSVPQVARDRALGAQLKGVRPRVLMRKAVPGL